MTEPEGAMTLEVVLAAVGTRVVLLGIRVPVEFVLIIVLLISVLVVVVLTLILVLVFVLDLLVVLLEVLDLILDEDLLLVVVDVDELEGGLMGNPWNGLRKIEVSSLLLFLI